MAAGSHAEPDSLPDDSTATSGLPTGSDAVADASAGTTPGGTLYAGSTATPTSAAAATSGTAAATSASTAASGAAVTSAASGAAATSVGVATPGTELVLRRPPDNNIAGQVSEVNYRGHRRRQRRPWEALGSIGVPILGVAGAICVVVLMVGVSLRPSAGAGQEAALPEPAISATDSGTDPSPSVSTPSASPSAKPTVKPSAGLSSAPVALHSTPSSTQRPNHKVTTTFEAEAPGNSRSGTQTTTAGSATVVYNIGNGNSLIFNGVAVSAADRYTVTFYYTSSEPRAATIGLNGSTLTTVTPPMTPDYSTVSAFALSLNLNAGANTIEVRNDTGGWAPRIDKITIR